MLLHAKSCALTVTVHPNWGHSTILYSISFSQTTDAFYSWRNWGPERQRQCDDAHCLCSAGCLCMVSEGCELSPGSAQGGGFIAAPECPQGLASGLAHKVCFTGLWAWSSCPSINQLLWRRQWPGTWMSRERIQIKSWMLCHDLRGKAPHATSVCGCPVTPVSLWLQLFYNGTQRWSPGLWESDDGLLCT